MFADAGRATRRRLCSFSSKRTRSLAIMDEKLGPRAAAARGRYRSRCATLVRGPDSELMASIIRIAPERPRHEPLPTRLAYFTLYLLPPDTHVRPPSRRSSCPKRSPSPTAPSLSLVVSTPRPSATRRGRLTPADPRGAQDLPSPASLPAQPPICAGTLADGFW